MTNEEVDAFENDLRDAERAVESAASRISGGPLDTDAKRDVMSALYSALGCISDSIHASYKLRPEE